MLVDNFDDLTGQTFEEGDGFTWADAEDEYFADLYQGPGPVDDIVADIIDIRTRIKARNEVADSLDIALGRIRSAREDAMLDGLDPELLDRLQGAESVVGSILGRIDHDNDAEDIDGYEGRGRTGGWASKDLAFADLDEVYILITPNDDDKHQGLFVFNEWKLAERLRKALGGFIITESILHRSFVDAIEGKPIEPRETP